MIDFKLIQLLLQITLMLSMALFLGRIARLLHLPELLGQLSAGIILGPTCLGIYLDRLYQSCFLQKWELSSEVNFLIQIGMLLFMFTSGMEIDLKKAKLNKKTIIHTSIMGFLVPFVLGFVSVCVFPGLVTEELSNHSRLFPVFMGIFISISALPVIIKILVDLKIEKSQMATVITLSAAIEDFIGWFIFTFALALSSTGNVILTIMKFLLCVFTIIYILPYFWRISTKIIEKRSGKSVNNLEFFIVNILLIAIYAECLGVHPYFAAFITGVVIKKYSKGMSNFVSDKLKSFTQNLFFPLYLVIMGLKINITQSLDVKIIVLVTIIACFGKVIGGGLGAYLGGMKFKESIYVGVGLNARGAVEIIIASIARQYNIINEKLFTALVLMAVLTTIIGSIGLKSMLEKDDTIYIESYK